MPVRGRGQRSGVTVGLNLEVRTVLPLQYRKGAVATSVRLSRLAAAVEGDSLAVRMRLDRMGTAAFIGTVRGVLADSAGTHGDHVHQPGGGLLRHGAAAHRGASRAARLLPGRYRLRVEVAAEREDLAPESLLPARPVRDSLEVRLP